MRPFCEIITSSILPAIRSIMTMELLRTYGMTQEKAAETLQVTQPAISQYYRQYRGSKIKLIENDKEIMGMITDLTRDIVNKSINSKEINKRFCIICKKIREKKIICKIHEEICPSIAPCEKCGEC
ncbi:MAG: hypothetical protein QXY45_03505 [Candidatus Aenigmatarchaeota archaeon]